MNCHSIINKVKIILLINGVLFCISAQTQTTPSDFQLQQASQLPAIDLTFEQYLMRNPIDDAALKAEYARQVDEIKANGSLQYQLRLLVLPTEAQAKEAIRNIMMGQTMDSLIRKSSTDPSRTMGGLLDWLLPVQLLPNVAKEIVNLTSGEITNTPIETQAGWNVIRVENTRLFVAPKFEDTLSQLRASLLKQRSADYSSHLRDALLIRAQKKCLELGFKSGTEKFGECVLKASK
jgi:peptidyl-prolyl cis-trans isomerase C